MSLHEENEEIRDQELEDIASSVASLIQDLGGEENEEDVNEAIELGAFEPVDVDVEDPWETDPDADAYADYVDPPEELPSAPVL